jgi:hypothetical protein
LLDKDDLVAFVLHAHPMREDMPVREGGRADEGDGLENR